MPFDAAVFDFNGTLVDSAKAKRDSMFESMRSFGLEGCGAAALIQRILRLPAEYWAL